ncbi:hypothetical protein ACFQPA_15410 [Halomarina halobia]|uniref:DUF7344 domain-containing protein n=1 Tax=Halomarina halobia TaxID=3033386 RepID=A0ABD6A7J2_9EURY|nr:hypothetical protein [Halomarina sp. PSR21]
MSGVPGSPSEARTVERALPVDTVFGLLSDGRRRRVLTYLDRHEPRIEVGRLAERLTEGRDGATPEAVAIALHHVHLPKLDAAGVVSYDAAARTVEREPAADQLRPYLLLARADERGDVGTGGR